MSIPFYTYLKVNFAGPGPMMPCLGETRTAPRARSKAKFKGRFSWLRDPVIQGLEMSRIHTIYIAVW